MEKLLNAAHNSEYGVHCEQKLAMPHTQAH